MVIIFQAERRALTHFSWSCAFFQVIVNGQLESLCLSRGPISSSSFLRWTLFLLPPSSQWPQWQASSFLELSLLHQPLHWPQEAPRHSSFRQPRTCSLRATSHSLLICIPWAQLLTQPLMITASIYISRFSSIAHSSGDFKEIRCTLSLMIQHVLKRWQKQQN